MFVKVLLVICTVSDEAQQECRRNKDGFGFPEALFCKKTLHEFLPNYLHHVVEVRRLVSAKSCLIKVCG